MFYDRWPGNNTPAQKSRGRVSATIFIYKLYLFALIKCLIVSHLSFHRLFIEQKIVISIRQYVTFNNIIYFIFLLFIHSSRKSVFTHAYHDVMMSNTAVFLK